jgi:hypothetical protein
MSIEFRSVDYLLDGMLSGTGIRDSVKGGYVAPADLKLSSGLQANIAEWQRNYEDAHFEGFSDETVAALDREGQELVALIRAERPQLRIGYFSNGLMRRIEC